MLLSLAFLSFLIACTAIFIYFGPRNWLAGLGYGAGLVAVVYVLGMRFPAVLAAAYVQGPENHALSRVAQAVISASDDPRTSSIWVVRILGGGLILVFLGLAVLFGVFMTALTLRHEYTSGLTGASVACGLFAALSYVIWDVIRKAGKR